MQNGSSRSKAAGARFRVNFQFIVKVKGDQSVSIMPVSGWIASFGLLNGPVAKRS